MYAGMRLIFLRAARRAQLAHATELRKTKQEIAQISAQDEFAKWARLQRRIDKLQAEGDAAKGSSKRLEMGLVFVGGLVLRAVVYVLVLWRVMFAGRGVGVMVLPKPIVGALYAVISLPNAPAGQLSVPVLFVVSTVALKRLLAVV